jgi:hypothetical protein
LNKEEKFFAKKKTIPAKDLGGNTLPSRVKWTSRYKPANTERGRDVKKHFHETPTDVTGHKA